MKVGLVLGGGGVLGGAWEVGALQALRRELGWEPRLAEYFVGTSVGALIVALLAAGLFPEPDLIDAAARQRDAFPWPLPGSWRLGAHGLRQRGPRRWIMTVSGMLPRGAMSTNPIRESLKRRIPGGWPIGRRLWIAACDYRTGERVVFERAGDPKVDLPTAVAASCAVPGVYAPVEIDGRLYVDGGLYSPASLDLLTGLDLDMVICLNPISSAATPPPHATLSSRLMALAEQAAHRSLVAEANAVRASGTPVILIEPGPQDLVAMGSNLMNPKRRRLVMDTAFRTVTEQLDSPTDARLRTPA